MRYTSPVRIVPLTASGKTRGYTEPLSAATIFAICNARLARGLPLPACVLPFIN